MRPRRAISLSSCRRSTPLSGGSLAGKLNVCLYGTRDAAINWQRRLGDHIISLGFGAGLGHPSVFAHRSRQLYCLVHGGDHVAAGDIADLGWTVSKLKARFEAKTQIA